MPKNFSKMSSTNCSVIKKVNVNNMSADIKWSYEENFVLEHSISNVMFTFVLQNIRK